jgi:hypothetical protein
MAKTKGLRMLSFEAWKAKIDYLLESQLGLSSDDLPDWKYRSDFDDGLSAHDTLLRVLKYAGF